MTGFESIYNSYFTYFFQANVIIVIITGQQRKTVKNTTCHTQQCACVKFEGKDSFILILHFVNSFAFSLFFLNSWKLRKTGNILFF